VPRRQIEGSDLSATYVIRVLQMLEASRNVSVLQIELNA
jgi:hypothetical protein